MESSNPATPTELTAHVGRHTFATLALTAGVPQVTIQQMLGHADLRMTQHYAKLVDTKVMKDMEHLQSFMSKRSGSDQTEERQMGLFRVI